MRKENLGPTGFAALKIVVVDDNRHMRSIIKSMLRAVGAHDPAEASDGESALELLKNYPADILLTDFAMPPMGGVALTRAIRTAPDTQNPYLPVIMISGYGSRGRVIEARDAGINEFLIKPVMPHSLLARLESVVMRPRPYIRCSTYFGPDRRRQKLEEGTHPLRRRTDRIIEDRAQLIG